MNPNLIIWPFVTSSFRGLFGAIACSFLVSSTFAQEGIIVPMSNGTVVVDCDATQTIYFTDDNSGSTDFQDPYSNQDYTITLCPSVPGDAVQVNFVAFDLQTNANPNNSDRLFAYNGDSTDGDLVGVGTANSFNGVSITASIDNPTGCVTFRFVVNNGATGGDAGWVAEVTCVTPCAYPESDLVLVSPEPFPGTPESVGVCMDELVTFDASGSLPGAPEFPVDSLIWNWGDGQVETTAVADGFQISHSYPEPGEYIVSLVVQDINGCNSTNLIPYQVLVSTVPIFNTEVTSPICVDAPGVLDGTPVESVTWTALPPVGVSELADLPDATGVAFTSQLFIDFFDTDQVLEFCDDLELITANIEHSFIGDLSFWITCPDGTEVLLMDNGASGGPDPTGCTPNDLGGNDLGIVDVEGFDYSWTMDAEWVLDDANNPNATNPMPAGTYLPCGDLCDFVGCPLNGIWTFNVIDQWAADNGTLFEWGIDFNPEIVPGITTFTPEIGMGSDSSYWHPVGDDGIILTTEDYGIVGVDEDANVVDVMFAEPGVYEFGYLVTNDFGCSWDTTVQVEVLESPQAFVSAGPDLEFCGEPIDLLGSYVPMDTANCGEGSGFHQYCYGANDNAVFSYCPNVPGDGTTMTLQFTGGELEWGWDYITVFDGPDGTGPVIETLYWEIAGQTFTPTNPDGCISFQITADGGGCDCATNSFCGFESLQWTTYCAPLNAFSNVEFSWSPDESLNDGSLLQPTLMEFEADTTAFVLTVEMLDVANCVASDTMLVVPGFAFDVDHMDLSCEGDDGMIFVDILGGDAAEDGPYNIDVQWNGPLCSGPGIQEHCYGAMDSTVFTHCPDNPGDGTMMGVEFLNGFLDSSGFDVVTVYNGANGEGEVLGVLFEDAFGQFTADNAFGQNPDGCISIRFESDGFCSCADTVACGLPPFVWETSCNTDAVEPVLVDSLVWEGATVVLDSLIAGEYEVVVSNADGCTYTQILELTAPDTIGLGGSLGSTIDWSLSTDTGLFAGAMGLPDTVWYENGQWFPIQAWLAWEGDSTFHWDGAPVDAIVIEGCEDASLVLQRAQAQTADSLFVEWHGTADAGVDHAEASSVFIMEPGTTMLTVPLQVANDGFSEGIEDVLIVGAGLDVCGDSLLDSLRLLILDPIPMEASSLPLDCIEDPGVQTVAFEGIEGFGPFDQMWEVSPSGDETGWMEMAGLATSTEVDMIDSSGQLMPNVHVALSLMDQCGHVAQFHADIEHIVAQAAQLCVDSAFGFPAANAHLPVLDVLIDGVSYFDNVMLQDTLTIAADSVDGHWMLDSVSTGPFDWTGIVTLVDTCGWSTSAQLYILEYICTEGCTDESACNFDVDAGLDDGSCAFTGDECEGEGDALEGWVLNEACDCVPVTDRLSEQDLAFDLSPNPNDGEFRIVANLDQGLLRVRSADGRLVHMAQLQALQQGVRLDLNLSNGMYLMELFSEGFHQTRRVVVQR